MIINGCVGFLGLQIIRNFFIMGLINIVAFVVMVAASVQAQASVDLINLVGDPITASCVADNANNRGLVTIGPNQIDSWAFNGDLLSMGWTCHFEWADSSDCASGTCTLHTQDVKVWQGVMGSRKLHVTSISLTPCVNCVWQIKYDGFHRADKKDLVYTFIAGWK